MTWNQNFIALLEEEFSKLRTRNPRISKRGFARMLGVSASTMFRVISGDLVISSDRALKMLENLPVETARLNELIFLMNHSYRVSPGEVAGLGSQTFVFKGSLANKAIYLNELYALSLRLANLSNAHESNMDVILKLEIPEGSDLGEK